MAIYCTCGAELPDDARFCHRCGRPQREEEHAPIVERRAPPPRPSINFSDRTAVRVGFLCGTLSAFLFSIPFVSLGCCVWFPAAGFLATFLYARRTGLALSAREGARLGWLTGLLTFLIWIVWHAITLALAPRGAIQEGMRQWINRVPVTDETTRQMLRSMIESPTWIAFMVVNSVILAFVLAASLTVAGGALGAKVMEKD